VPTRPVAQNGLNLSIPDAALELMRLKSMFPRLPDTPTIYQVWESLVIRYQVSGKPAHDARLVAALTGAWSHRHSHFRHDRIIALRRN